MKKYIKKPKTKLFGSPFVNGFTDIETENSDLIIGSSEKFEDIFTTNFPEYLKIICEIEHKAEFPNITISAGYKITDDGERKLIEYNIYDGKILPMDKVVSEISIKFLDFSNDYNNLTWKNELLSNPIIYQKRFKLQNKSRRIDNFLDKSMEQSGILHTKSKAHYFGGNYFNGIKLSDIQPCLFCLGTGIQGKEYIRLFTAKDILQNNLAELTPEIEKSDLTTLEDDICSGQLMLQFQDQIYKSIMATKETLLSKVLQILFRKEF